MSLSDPWYPWTWTCLNGTVNFKGMGSCFPERFFPSDRAFQILKNLQKLDFKTASSKPHEVLTSWERFGRLVTSRPCYGQLCDIYGLSIILAKPINRLITTIIFCNYDAFSKVFTSSIFMTNSDYYSFNLIDVILWWCLTRLLFCNSLGNVIL